MFPILLAQPTPYLGLIPIICAVAAFFIAVSFNQWTNANAGLKKAMRKKAQRNTEIGIGADADELIGWILKDPSLHQFEFYGDDPSTGTLVFGTKHSSFSNGFYHRVFATKKADGTAVLHIETMSKSIQIGPVVSKNHKTFTDVIERVASVFHKTYAEKIGR